MASMLWYTGSSSLKQDRGIVFVQGLGLDVWLNCLGSIFSWVLGPRFYVQTDPKWEPGSDYWYTNRPVGKKNLGGYIEDMMKRGVLTATSRITL